MYSPLHHYPTDCSLPGSQHRRACLLSRRFHSRQLYPRHLSVADDGISGGTLLGTDARERRARPTANDQRLQANDDFKALLPVAKTETNKHPCLPRSVSKWVCLGRG